MKAWLLGSNTGFFEYTANRESSDYCKTCLHVDDGFCEYCIHSPVTVTGSISYNEEDTKEIVINKEDNWELDPGSIGDYIKDVHDIQRT